MAQRKIKIEFNDGDGGKYTISLDGSMSREKVLKMMDMVELLGEKSEQEEPQAISTDTSFGKLYQLIEKKFPLGSFTSADVLEAYEDEYNKPARLSTISTYLSRLEQKRLLSRQRTASGWTYRRERVGSIQR